LAKIWEFPNSEREAELLSSGESVNAARVVQVLVPNRARWMTAVCPRFASVLWTPSSHDAEPWIAP